MSRKVIILGTAAAVVLGMQLLLNPIMDLVSGAILIGIIAAVAFKS